MGIRAMIGAKSDRVCRIILVLIVLSFFLLRAEGQTCIDRHTGLLVVAPRGWRFDADRISPVLASFPPSMRVPINLVPLNHAEIVITKVDLGVGDSVPKIEKYLDVQQIKLREEIPVRSDSAIRTVIKVTSGSIFPKGTEIDYFMELNTKWFRISVLYRGGAISRQIVADTELLLGRLQIAIDPKKYPSCPGK